MSVEGDGHDSQEQSARPGYQRDEADAVERPLWEAHNCPEVAEGIKTSRKGIDSENLDLDSDVGKETTDRQSSMSSRHGDTHQSFRSRLQTNKTLISRTSNFWYKKYILHGLLRRRELPVSENGRHIPLDASRHVSLIDERTGHQHISNIIRSNRYNIWNFLPYQIFYQLFSKAANVYFLLMAILQLIPGLSTTGQFTTAVPLIFFILLSIAKEGHDDFRRYRLDKVENRRLSRVLYGYRTGGVLGQSSQTMVGITQVYLEGILDTFQRAVIRNTPMAVTDAPGPRDSSATGSDPWMPPKSQPSPWATVQWANLKVGDIIELRRNDLLPADVILLHADGRNGVAYIETMALDGETNLKTRQPPTSIAERCNNLIDLSTCRAEFAVEDPNRDLYEFQGKVTVEGSTLPLTLNNVVFRGSTLRNTNRAVGIIVNTGEECKIRKNASKRLKPKAPVMQKTANKVVIILAFFVILVSVGCSAGYIHWTRYYENKAWYLDGGHVRMVEIIIAFFIMFNNLIPLALYISLEIVKLFQYWLLHDIEMYDKESDTPMVSNTQTMFENLGQINYIFSDKTGTLTENVMRFRKLSVAGTSWVHNMEKSRRDKGVGISANANLASLTSQDTVAKSATKNFMTVSPTTSADSGLHHSLPVITLANSELVTPELGTAELIAYLQRHPDTSFARRVRLFFLSLALCHTCFPEAQENGETGYQASSPDELALVEAAQELGYVVIDRPSNSITLNTYPDKPEIVVQQTYQILDVIEFSSKRKRMSIVIKFPDGKICIFCKGADSAIEVRLKDSSLALKTAEQVRRKHELRASEEAERVIARKSEELLSRKSLSRFGMNLHVPSMDQRRVSLDRASSELDNLHVELRRSRERDHRDRNRHIDVLVRDAESLDEAGVFQRCFQHLNGFASDGLRTLVYAYRFIEEDEYASWANLYHEATTSLVNREEMIESTGELIEKELDLAGATAIEDKLQLGVPETIDKLRRANIKIWMLTGDKRETAINIAHSARLFKSYSQTVVLQHDQKDLGQLVNEGIAQVATGRHTVVVIEGQTLTNIENNEELSTAFYDLLIRADSVICCRASPSQKATMVKAIRRKVPKSVTLAIGDGGNDISMIQEAHVGVGISGKEGLQAARVADFSIAQFRFLQRLLLVHGHWNYIRTAKNILWTFWKEMLFYGIQIIFTSWAGYTGTSLYESDSLTVWNTLFTSLCVMIPGIFEQDLSAATLLAVPELYAYGQQSKAFNLKIYGWWMVLAGVQSVVIWFCIYGLFGLAPFTEDQGLFALGDLAFSICVVYINIKLLIINYHYKTWIPLSACVVTIAGWWAWNLFLPFLYSPAPDLDVKSGFLHHFGRNPTWWAVLIVSSCVLIVADLAIDACGKWWWPSKIEIWQELEGSETVRMKLKEVGGEGGYSIGLWGRDGEADGEVER